jgi:hypothetical protein
MIGRYGIFGFNGYLIVCSFDDIGLTGERYGGCNKPNYVPTVQDQAESFAIGLPVGTCNFFIAIKYPARV